MELVDWENFRQPMHTHEDGQMINTTVTTTVNWTWTQFTHALQHTNMSWKHLRFSTRI